MFTTNYNALFQLNHLSLIGLHGDHPDTFLQGQLTCDIKEVSLSQMQPAALCNLNGRVLALLEVIQWQGLKLILDASLTPIVTKTLSKAALLSRIAFEECNNINIYGFYLADHNGLTPFNLPLPKERFAQTTTDTICVYALGDSLYMVLVTQDQAAPLETSFTKEGQYFEAAYWHSLLLQRKHFAIYPKTQGQFLPHRLGLHQSGHISFNKGCYRGQEIIARTQYRAKLKHSLRLFLIDNNDLTPGLKIFSATEPHVEIGELVDCSPYGNNGSLIVASIIFEYPKEVIFEGFSDVRILKEFPVT